MEGVEDLYNWVKEALFGALDLGRGRFVMAGNLISKNSVLQKMTESDGVDVIQVNAVDEKGEPVWKDKWTKEEAKAAADFMGYYAWNKEYMHNPIVAGKWERIEKDGDEYLLQYRTAGDDKVSPEHASLNGVTLPPSDTFWDEYYPPNGWNCRCSVAQVRRDKFPQTDREEAFTRARKALAKDENGMFRFNPGKQERTFPDYNPYTISKCKNCPKAKNLAAGIPENELCEACELLSVRMVNSVGHASDRIVEYDQEQWEHTYISTQADGLVVTEHGRIAESEINEKEKAKYKKELSMCFDIADNGHDVEFLHGENRPKGQTFDIRIDGIPADLKFIEESGSNIPRYAKYAFRNQGAEIVVFRLSSHSAYDKIKEAHRKYGAEGQIYFYFADDTRLRRIKKRGQ